MTKLEAHKLGKCQPAARLARASSVAVAATLVLFALRAPAYAHYAKTTKTIIYNGKPVPPGRYVFFEFDGGDEWLNTVGQATPGIPKDSVEVIPSRFFRPHLLGAVEKSTPLLVVRPTATEDLPTLEVSASDAQGRPFIAKARAQITIEMQEQNDYIGLIKSSAIEPAPPGRSSESEWRIPMSAVEITSGDPADGITPRIMKLAQEDRHFQAPLMPAEAAAAFNAKKALTWGGFFELWLVLSGSLMAFHYLGGRIAATKSNRSRLWKLRKGRYWLDKITGDWRRITKKSISGGVLVDAEPRAKRLVNEDVQWRYRLRRGAVNYVAFGFGASIAAAALIHEPPFWPGVFGLFLMVFAPVSMMKEIAYMTGAYLSGGGTMVLDPPAEQPEADPFGPTDVTSPVDHPAAADLAYKPNA